MSLPGNPNSANVFICLSQTKCSTAHDNYFLSFPPPQGTVKYLWSDEESCRQSTVVSCRPGGRVGLCHHGAPSGGATELSVYTYRCGVQLCHRLPILFQVAGCPRPDAERPPRHAVRGP